MSTDDEAEAWAREWPREQEEIARAWQQPAFSRETIENDVWTAVHLPIPENADRKLLEYAHGWAVDLQHYAEGSGVFAEPLAGPALRLTQQEHIDAAGVRVDTLGAMIGEAALQEAAAVDPQKVEQVRTLLDMAGDMHSHYDVSWQDGGFAVVRTFEIDDAMLSEYRVPAEQTIYNAATIDALADKVIAAESWRLKAESSADASPAVNSAAEFEAMSIRDGEAAEVMPAAQSTNFLSGWFTAKNLGSSLLRTAHMLTGAVIGFFVDEPKMTAAQVHDTLQHAGNVDLLHAREVAAVEAVEAGAHEERMLAMKGDQQTHDFEIGVQAGTNATAEANLGLDAYEPQRRKQSQSQSM